MWSQFEIFVVFKSENVYWKQPNNLSDYLIGKLYVYIVNSDMNLARVDKERYNFCHDTDVLALGYVLPLGHN